MTDWNRVAPKRADNAVKALGLVAKTAARHYDVPAAEAAQMIEQLRAALDDVLVAYEARGVGSGVIPAQSEPAPEAKPCPVWRDPPHQDQIARFVADVPSDQVSSYITHLVHRLCERADAAKAED